MAAWGKSLPRTLAVIVVVLVVGTLLTLLTRTGATPAAQAQLPTDFSLQVSSGTITANGASSDIIVSLVPGQSAIAAVGAQVTLDTTDVLVEDCVALVGLGVCNTETPGVVNLQTVDPNGWATTTDLFRLTFSSQGLTADAQLELTLIEAFDIAGIQIIGNTVDGGLELGLNGDVDCDGTRSIGDALIIAQFVVGLREPSPCPLEDPRRGIDLRYADATRDDELDIGDALLVARCTVGLLGCDE